MVLDLIKKFKIEVLQEWSSRRGWAGPASSLGSTCLGGYARLCGSNCLAQFLKAGAPPVGAGVPANTGEARAIHRTACFAAVRRIDAPAPTGYRASCSRAGYTVTPCAYANCCRESAREKRFRIARAGFSTSSHDTYPANQDAGTAANINQYGPAHGIAPANTCWIGNAYR